MARISLTHSCDAVSAAIDAFCTKVVDDEVDPFNLPQVMWALSTKMNPSGDLIVIPNLPVLELAPQANTPGVVDKLIIDATTPVDPDNRGNYSSQVHDLPEMGAWLTKLQALAAR